jgi:excinuclease ABC subunit C
MYNGLLCKETVDNRKIAKILASTSSNPGVYQFFDKQGALIYVGKAKNLKKRVSSYFIRNEYENNKVKILVSKVTNIKFIEVDSESDALLLENNLIKKYQPRYNILLKDDKTFPWICIKKEHFPRIFITRKCIADGSEYFGPYTSVVMVKTLLSLVKELYPLRSCNYDLSNDKISTNSYKPCLEFHVGNCKAPCIGNQLHNDYMSDIQSVKKVLKGDISEVISYLSNFMQDYSKKLDFEHANIIKSKIEILKNYRSKSTIVSSSINNVDVFSIVEDKKFLIVNYLRIAKGAIIQVHSLSITKKLSETREEVLSTAIVDIRQKMFSNSREILVSILPDMVINDIKYTIPKKGDKLKLIQLSERNARLFLNEIRNLNSLREKKIQSSRTNLLSTMKKELRLKSEPSIIECFDNSNLQGSNPVASCVVFSNGKPMKNEYRHYNIKSVQGIDDYASMREVISRRYRRIIDEKKRLPDLIVIDGGKGQINAAVEILKTLEIIDKISVIGIAKRLEEIYYPNDPLPLYLNKDSLSLKVIQNIRNEAHRFGINFHRKKRSKSFESSYLDEIHGIGKNTKVLLYQHFKSLHAILEADEVELVKLIGISKTKKILERFKVSKS